MLQCQTITSAAQAAKGGHQGVTFHPTGQRLCPTDVSTSSQRLHHAQDFCTLTPKLQCHLIASDTGWVFLPRKRSWRWREGTWDRWSHMFPSFLYTHASFWFTKFLKKNKSRKAWVSQSSHPFSQKASITTVLLQHLILAIFCWSKLLNKPFSWLQGHKTVLAQIKSSHPSGWPTHKILHNPRPVLQKIPMWLLITFCSCCSEGGNRNLGLWYLWNNLSPKSIIFSLALVTSALNRSFSTTVTGNTLVICSDVLSFLNLGSLLE